MVDGSYVLPRPIFCPERRVHSAGVAVRVSRSTKLKGVLVPANRSGCPTTYPASPTSIPNQTAVTLAPSPLSASLSGPRGKTQRIFIVVACRWVTQLRAGHGGHGPGPACNHRTRLADHDWPLNYRIVSYICIMSRHGRIATNGGVVGVGESGAVAYCRGQVEKAETER